VFPSTCKACECAGSGPRRGADLQAATHQVAPAPLQVRCALARALLAQSKQEAARQHYLAALDLITGPEEHDQVQRELEALQPFA
jgi:hypothetical protein